MRFKLSRLAQAIIVAALCSSTAIAADTGIQASENSLQREPSVTPVSSSVIQSAPGERVARPYIPDRTDNSVISVDNKIYGPVTKTDSTWSIANKIRKLYPGQGITTRQIMRVLYRKNRQAYADAQLDSLFAGSYLAIPSLDEIKTGTPVSSLKQTAKQSVSNTQTAESAVTINEVVTSEVATSSAPATILPAPAPAPAPAPEETATVPVSSAEQPLVDSKVSELVNGTVSEASATIPVPAAESTTGAQTEEVLKYQAENKELKAQIERLNDEISTLRASVQKQEKTQPEQQGQLIEQEQTTKPVQEKKINPVPPGTPATGVDSWSDILALPLHVQLLMSLPVLAFLVVLSIWLRARIRHEPVVRNQENTEPEIQVIPDAATTTAPVADITEVQNIANIIPDAQPVEADKETDKSSASLLTATDEPAFVAEMPVPVFTAEPETSDFIPEQKVNLVADIEPVSSVEEVDIVADVAPVSAVEEVDIVADVAPVSAIEEVDIVADVAPVSAVEDVDIVADVALVSAIEEVDIVADVSPVPAAEAEINDAVLASRLNLNKIMAAPGLQMSDQVVSEPEGWALSDDEEAPAVLTATIAPGVNLKEVHNDSNRSWLQQFEPEQLKDNSSEGEGYLTIDELLSQAEQQEVEGAVNPDMMQPNLDVGLDAYPDMLPKHDGVDIDNDGGVGNKLDLARAYLEIDDKASAKALLLEAMAEGNNEQIKEAVRLLSRTV